MAGTNLEVHDGKVFLMDLKELKVVGLHGAIHHRRLVEPLEGVEIRSSIWIDQVSMAGEAEPFRYMFGRRDNDVFLYRVRRGPFTEPEIIYFADLAKKYG